MPIVVEVKSKEDYAKWVAAQKKKARRGRRRPEQGVGPEGAGGARREGVRGELRRLPPGDRQGRRRARSRRSTARSRHRSQGRADQDGAERRASATASRPR